MNAPVNGNTAKDPTPGLPVKLDIGLGGSLFSMHYRHGMNSKLEKIFMFNGELFEARKRAEKHCEIMGYKLIWVRPLVINLEAEESQQLGRVKE